MRNIDDTFFIWSESQDELEGFFQHMNAFHPYLKFTYEKVFIIISDVTVIINDE